MTAKEYLSRGYEMDREIRIKNMRIVRLKAIASMAQATISEAPKPSSSDLHRMETIMAEVIDLEKELADDIVEFTNAIKEIQAAITTVMNTKEALVLEMRYLAFMKWEDIAKELNMGIRNALLIHSKGLKHVRI